jgi:hypothetical protein
MINNNFNSSLLFSYIGKQQRGTAEAGIFKLPITVETGKLGSKINPAGFVLNLHHLLWHQ